MSTSEAIKLTGIPRQQLYYLEQKGYVIPKRTPSGDIDIGEFSSEDLEKIRFMWKYLKMGFKHKVAHLKALEQLA